MRPLFSASATFMICTNYDTALMLAQDDRNVLRSDKLLDPAVGKRLFEAKRDPEFLQRFFNHLSAIEAEEIVRWFVTTDGSPFTSITEIEDAGKGLTEWIIEKEQLLHGTIRS